MSGLLAAIPLLFLAACATSPLGRSQIKLYSQPQMAKMGLEAFQQIEQKTPVSKNRHQTQVVNCVAQALTRQVTNYQANWRVRLFQSDQVNAFALPGGEIGVYSGLLKVADNQDQLAAVIGHEISHVLADHANERVSQSQLAQAGLQLAGAAGLSSGTLALMGVGAQVGILLPFSRAQESEADMLGMDLMARAGFDPRQAVALWRNMARAASSGSKPPELLSTHPADATRIDQLQARLPRDLPIYQAARATGRRPNCGKI
jgi:Putative Zn-dependent protease, contains TPR repeats